MSKPNVYLASLRLPTAATIEKIAAEYLTIDNQVTGSPSNFVLTPIQKEILQEFCNPDNHKNLLLKARQVYGTTTAALFILFFALINPRSNIAIVTDNLAKSAAVLEKVVRWSEELHCPRERANSQYLELKNRSRIEALSAGARAGADESRVGRSKSYHLIVCSEIAFWPDPDAAYKALVSTLVKNGRIVIESTAVAAHNLFYQLWTGQSDWNRTFIGTEQHAAYQTDGSSISDTVWDICQKRYGFTSRTHAAWWWDRFQNLFMGDEPRMLREHPITPEQAFTAAEGRFFSTDPQVLPYQVDPDIPDLRIFIPPKTEGIYYIGVDTAKGVGSDASAVAVIEATTGRLAASYRNNTVPVPEFAQLVRKICGKYHPAKLHVETNGIGSGCYQLLLSYGLPARDLNTAENTKYMRLVALRSRIADGSICGPPELLEECQSSTIRNEKFVGKDDLLMALGLVVEELAKKVHLKPPLPPDYRTHFRPIWKRQRATY